MRTFKEILSELGEKLDSVGIIPLNQVDVSTVTLPNTTTSPVVSTELFIAEPTKTQYMREIVKLGVTANGGQYRVIIFDDGKMRVYQNVKTGWKQVSENSTDTPKSAMYAYLSGPFMAPRINDFLWNVIDAKLFPEEIK